MVMGYPEDDAPKHAKPDVTPPVQPTPGLGGPAVTPEPEYSGLDESVRKEPEVVSKFGIPWKAILGFLTVFVGQLLARATVNGVAVLPENVSGWIALLGGSFTAAAVIYLKQNVYTVPQAEKNLAKAEARAAA